MGPNRIGAAASTARWVHVVLTAQLVPSHSHVSAFSPNHTVRPRCASYAIAASPCGSGNAPAGVTSVHVVP
jgi:hypothetical protein